MQEATVLLFYDSDGFVCRWLYIIGIAYVVYNKVFIFINRDAELCRSVSLHVNTSFIT